MFRTFDDLPERDKIALRNAAARQGADVAEIYTRPRPASEWEQRARIAAEWLADAPELADIGCGSMTLRRLLSPAIRYQGIDIVVRDADTLVVNLNQQTLPQLDFTTAAALGVMEYLYDPERFLKSLRQFDQVVFSYCTRTIKLRRAARVSRLWVNHFSGRELEALLGQCGFRIVRRRRIGFSERLYLLE